MACDFVTALKGKYQYRFEPIVTDPAIEIVTNTRLTLNSIEVADLSGSRLEVSGSPGQISRTSPKIKELDIARTRVTDWNEIVRIATELPVLPT